MPQPESNSASDCARAQTRRTKSSFLYILLCFLGLLLACAPSAPALEPTTPLASYSRQSWVMENGLPQNTVQALAQTRDGFLWIGTEVGLVRFDGNNFVLSTKTPNLRWPAMTSFASSPPKTALSGSAQQMA